MTLAKDTKLTQSDHMSDTLRLICQQPIKVWMVKLADRNGSINVYRKKYDQSSAKVEA